MEPVKMTTIPAHMFDSHAHPTIILATLAMHFPADLSRYIATIYYAVCKYMLSIGTSFAIIATPFAAYWCKFSRSKPPRCTRMIPAMAQAVPITPCDTSSPQGAIAITRGIILSVSAGISHAVVLTSECVLVSGYNHFAQLGLPMKTRKIHKDRMVLVFGRAEAAYAGGWHTMIISNRALYGCGYNAYGQLGIQTYSKCCKRLTLIPLEHVISCVCGTGYTLVLAANATSASTTSAASNTAYSAFIFGGDDFDPEIRKIDLCALAIACGDPRNDHPRIQTPAGWHNVVYCNGKITTNTTTPQNASHIADAETAYALQQRQADIADGYLPTQFGVISAIVFDGPMLVATWNGVYFHFNPRGTDPNVHWHQL